MRFPPHSITRLILLFCALLTLLSVGKRAHTAEGDAAKSDLDVTYIERTPLFPAYTVAYDVVNQVDVPTLVDPQTRVPLIDAEAQAIKRQPAVGDKVTFTAHIVNKGAGVVNEWDYQWFVDDKPALSGTVKKPLKSGEEGAVTENWVWQTGAHRVRCTVDPQRKLGQTTTKNNTLEVATDAWLLALIVDQQTYDKFNNTTNLAGSRSFEDWAQWHIAKMNALFQASPSPLNPRGGSRARVACGKILVVPDASQPWSMLVPMGGGTALEAGYDGVWAFGHAPDVRKWASAPDWGLIHEWGHQLGLTDENTLDCASGRNLIADEGGDPLIIGHKSSLAGYMMHTPGDVLFSPQCMAALETQYGKRRGYYGDYYYALPATNALLVMDAAGKPLPNARVAFWQDNADNILAGDPMFSGNTDTEGKFVLPNRPAPACRTESGFTLRDNPFGQVDVTGAHGLFFIRITARGQSDYTWLDIAEINMSVWNGNKNLATYPRKTHISPMGGLKPPDSFKAELLADSVTLTWDAVGGANSYRIYHSTPDQAEWLPVGNAVADTTIKTALNPNPAYHNPADHNALHRYVVVSVGADNKESGFSNTASVMALQQPWAVAATSAGKRLLCDRYYGQTILQKANGNFVGLVGETKMDLRGASDLVIDSKGRILTVKGSTGRSGNTGNTAVSGNIADGENSGNGGNSARLKGSGNEGLQGFIIRNADMTEVLRVLQPPGSQTQHFQNPMGITVDNHDNIFICDTGNDRIQEYGPDGKFKAVIGVGLLKQPMKLAIDKHDNLIICDTGSDRLTVLRHDADGIYRLHGHANNLPRPVYIVTDAEGRFFISCEGDNTVVAMNSQFYKLPWKSSGADGFRLKAPGGLALDGKGNMLVVDTGNKRVVEVRLP